MRQPLFFIYKPIKTIKENGTSKLCRSIKRNCRDFKKNESDIHELQKRVNFLIREFEKPTEEWMPKTELKINVAGSYRKEFVERMTEILDSPKVTINGSHNFRMKMQVLFKTFSISKLKEQRRETINFTTFCDYFFHEKEK